MGNPARGWGIPTYLQSYLVKVVTKVYYLVSRPAEDTYIPPCGVPNHTYPGKNPNPAGLVFCSVLRK